MSIKFAYYEFHTTPFQSAPLTCSPAQLIAIFSPSLIKNNFIIMRETVLAIIATSIIIVIVLILMKNVVDNAEITECHTWEEQATQYQGFYVVAWQHDECLAHHITLNAPVK